MLPWNFIFSLDKWIVTERLKAIIWANDKPVQQYIYVTKLRELNQNHINVLPISVLPRTYWYNVPPLFLRHLSTVHVTSAAFPRLKYHRQIDLLSQSLRFVIYESYINCHTVLTKYSKDTPTSINDLLSVFDSRTRNLDIKIWKILVAVTCCVLLFYSQSVDIFWSVILLNHYNF